MVKEPSERFRDLDYLISRIGMPAVMCGLLLWFMHHDYAVFKRDIQWKMERSIRNERAIMQKLAIPIILDGDQKEK